MRLRLKPRDTSVLSLLSDQAKLLPVGAEILAQVVGSAPAARVALAEQMRDAEHQADEATHAILRRVNETFVTPFDRDDIYELASRLDDCMDYMEEVADLIVLYRLGELPAGVVAQVGVLQRCAELTAEAMPRLSTMKNLREYWVEINSLENEGDRTHRRLISDIFDGQTPAGSDPIAIMKIKEIADNLEAAIDAFETAANAVETIVLKEA
ncbi:DUF47 domain-containing protein [Serinibacter arcticus]|uniref:DUF47 domain-containing protein n=1 Tax=Serinibacter arcticus TaxID=1655435 RepID=A0A2U1ZY38_9MICO|nr:DUF47 family protein [Serinibacter arcticus]PWD51832.1 DUF47 domain-containing protein [Serinibacter arcticus]